VHNYSISPEKVGGSSKDSKGKSGEISSEDKDALPVFTGQSSSTSLVTDAPAPDISSVPPTTVFGSGDSYDAIAAMPPMFTPSIKKTLNKPGVNLGSRPIPLPDSLSVSVLKSRLDGKKKIKYVYPSVVLA
jgi:DNA-3-methyladenine glycosylase II